MLKRMDKGVEQDTRLITRAGSKPYSVKSLNTGSLVILADGLVPVSLCYPMLRNEAFKRNMGVDNTQKDNRSK